MLNKIYIGLGSNLGDSIKIFSESIKKIISDKDFFFHSISSPYISEPIGYTKQSDFFNAVLCVKSKLCPHSVLKKLLEIVMIMLSERLNSIRYNMNYTKTILVTW